MLTKPRSEVIPTLFSDSEGLTMSESCVRSDIANIIKKIYSPRPLMPIMTVDSAVESGDNMGDNVRISRRKEKEEKRFGFYFEPVTEHFAKTLVDSSTTSGSVSVPIFRYKPKRLRNVCDCCKRKIPHHVDESRTKRACRACVIYKRNVCSDVGNSSSNACFKKRVYRSNSKMEASNYEVVRINSDANPTMHNSKVRVSNYEVRVHPCTIQDTAQSSSVKLQRKKSLIDLTRKRPESFVKSENTQSHLDYSLSNLQVQQGQNTASNEKTNEPTPSLEKAEVKRASFLQRLMSSVVCQNKLLESQELGTIPSSQKIDSLKHAEKKSSKTSMKLEKAVNQQRNTHLSENIVQIDSTIDIEDPKGPSGISRPMTKEEMGEAFDITDQNKQNGQVLSRAKDKSESVIIDSIPEMITSVHKIEKSDENGDGTNKDIFMTVEDVGSIVIDEGMRNKTIEDSEKYRGKYQVAYKSLKLEVDTDWAYEFWARFFGTCHKVISFFTAFFLHFLTFVLQSLIQPFFCGTVRVSSEHFFKPCLLTAFESVMQPLCNLIESLAGSVRDVCIPLAQCFGVFCEEVSHVCKACRIVEINKNYYFSEKLRNP